jgi:hypothetical protein
MYLPCGDQMSGPQAIEAAFESGMRVICFALVCPSRRSQI